MVRVELDRMIRPAPSLSTVCNEIEGLMDKGVADAKELEAERKAKEAKEGGEEKEDEDMDEEEDEDDLEDEDEDDDEV